MASPGQTSLTNALTDLMTSLAVIFILLLVVFMKQASDASRRAKEDIQESLVEYLKSRDLELRQDPDNPLTLSVPVGEGKLQFGLGSAEVPAESLKFLRPFFRDFADRICTPQLTDKIDAIVIEGHTDRSGEGRASGVQHNIVLSQRRSFSILREALESVKNDPSKYECLLKLVSASGRGSRSPITTGGAYDAARSRRVEIKIRVRSSEQQFQKIVTGALAK